MRKIELFDGNIDTHTIDGCLYINLNQLHVFLEVQTDLVDSLPKKYLTINNEYWIAGESITEYFQQIKIPGYTKKEFFKKYSQTSTNIKVTGTSPKIDPEFIDSFDFDPDAKPFTSETLESYYLEFTGSDRLPKELPHRTALAQVFVRAMKQKNSIDFRTARKTKKRTTYYYGIRYVGKKIETSSITYFGKPISVRLHQKTPQIDLLQVHAQMNTGQNIQALTSQINPLELTIESGRLWASKTALDYYLDQLTIIPFNFKALLQKSFEDWTSTLSFKDPEWQDFLDCFTPDSTAKPFSVEDLKSYYLTFMKLSELPTNIFPTAIALAQEFVRSMKNNPDFRSKRLGVNKITHYYGLKFTH